MIANDVNRGLDVGMNPAWRDTVAHFIVVRSWRDGMSQDYIRAIYDDITYNKTRVLRDLDPDSGAYFNEVSIASSCKSYNIKLT